MNSPGFAEEVLWQAALINQSDQQEDIMGWIESVSTDWDGQDELFELSESVTAIPMSRRRLDRVHSSSAVHLGAQRAARGPRR